MRTLDGLVSLIFAINAPMLFSVFCVQMQEHLLPMWVVAMLIGQWKFYGTVCLSYWVAAGRETYQCVWVTAGREHICVSAWRQAGKHICVSGKETHLCVWQGDTSVCLSDDRQEDTSVCLRHGRQGNTSVCLSDGRQGTHLCMWVTAGREHICVSEWRQAGNTSLHSYSFLSRFPWGFEIEW